MSIKNKKRGPDPLPQHEWQILARRGETAAAIRSYQFHMRKQGAQIPLNQAAAKVRKYVRS